jgi:putative Mn2+ efflux pump MntP
MTRLLLLGVLAGIDNLQVAAAISVAPLTRARRALLLAAFAVCEIASPLIGVFFAHTLQTRFAVSFEGIGPFVVVACGIAIVWLALREQKDDAAALVNSRWTLIGLPLSLSFDNLLIGISAATLGHPPALAALVIGAISAFLCVTGIVAGARISRLIPKRAELVSGCALIIIAASMWIRS